MVAEKGRENERKWRKGKAAAKLPPTVYFQCEVIDRFVQTEAYICLEPREITKKKTETKSYYKDKMGRNKKLQEKQQKSEMQENRGCRMNSALEA